MGLEDASIFIPCIEARNQILCPFYSFIILPPSPPNCARDVHGAPLATGASSTCSPLLLRYCIRAVVATTTVAAVVLWSSLHDVL